jgi:hypothetical protein
MKTDSVLNLYGYNSLINLTYFIIFSVNIFNFRCLEAGEVGGKGSQAPSHHR